MALTNGKALHAALSDVRCAAGNRVLEHPTSALSLGPRRQCQLADPAAKTYRSAAFRQPSATPSTGASGSNRPPRRPPRRQGSRRRSNTSRRRGRRARSARGKPELPTRHPFASPAGSSSPPSGSAEAPRLSTWARSGTPTPASGRSTHSGRTRAYTRESTNPPTATAIP